MKSRSGLEYPETIYDSKRQARILNTPALFPLTCDETISVLPVIPDTAQRSKSSVNSANCLQLPGNRVHVTGIYCTYLSSGDVKQILMILTFARTQDKTTVTVLILASSCLFDPTTSGQEWA